MKCQSDRAFCPRGGRVADPQVFPTQRGFRGVEVDKTGEGWNVVGDVSPMPHAQV